MRKIIAAITLTVAFAAAAFAQSGVGGLKGFVASSFRNGSAIDAKVELTLIENHSKTKTGASTETTGGYYEMEVSFGYYILTISAKGYKTYTTKVFIPSSRTLDWATILEKKGS